ncbi:MAG: hypothetical protein K2W96_12495 [Gemmataceae bacterium]|nr:hypothetical protein [Gemmataceae bacterium]
MTACIHCNATLTASDLATGWCDSCGKRLPTAPKPAAPAKQAEAPPAAKVSNPTAWPVIAVLAITLLATGGLAAMAFAR